MTDDQREPRHKNSGTHSGNDDDAALQEELRRETAEGRDTIGDVGRNSNLSGSSTWETLPTDDDESPDEPRAT